jgi:hypothetical protein
MESTFGCYPSLLLGIDQTREWIQLPYILDQNSSKRTANINLGDV